MTEIEILKKIETDIANVDWSCFLRTAEGEAHLAVRKWLGEPGLKNLARVSDLYNGATEAAEAAVEKALNDREARLREVVGELILGLVARAMQVLWDRAAVAAAAAAREYIRNNTEEKR